MSKKNIEVVRHKSYAKSGRPDSKQNVIAIAFLEVIDKFGFLFLYKNKVQM